MSKEVMEKACEPFFTTKREGEGTGLGLSMAYGFVKQSAGHFKIYSEAGHGTTVKMYFPRSLQQESETEAYLTGPVSGGTETILVAEDDPAVQETVVELLAGLGYRVLKADNASQAMVVLRSGIPIDMLFTDVVMPGDLRSPELARQAKAMFPGIEVLFTSGYTQNAIVHGGRLDPGVQLISKPYTREQLARKVRHMLTNRQQTVLARATTPYTRTTPTVDKIRQPAGRVLVVEDNVEVRTLAIDLWSALGYTVVAVGNGEEAISLASQQAFDIVFTDFSLPGMNGMTMAEVLRGIAPQTHIILASGYGKSIVGASDIGAIVISKPFDLSMLESVLRSMEIQGAQQPQGNLLKD